ncbi:MAG: hypothetical protein WB661_10545, partial [Candidatus Bathyarchaeia archaeon]
MNEIFAWLTWALPSAGAILTPALARIHSKARDYGSVTFSLLGAISAALLIPSVLSGSVQDVQLEWITSL